MAAGQRGHLAGQRLVKPLQHTGGQQEVTNLLGQLVEHLFGEIGVDRLRVALHGLGQSRTGPLPRQQTEELETTGPAGQLAPHLLQLFGCQGMAQLLMQKLLGLRQIELQMASLDAGRHPLDLQTGHPQGRQQARGDHQLDVGRQMQNELAQQLVDARLLDHMIIIQH